MKSLEILGPAHPCLWSSSPASVLGLLAGAAGILTVGGAVGGVEAWMLPEPPLSTETSSKPARCPGTGLHAGPACPFCTLEKSHQLNTVMSL